MYNRREWDVERRKRRERLVQKGRKDQKSPVEKERERGTFTNSNPWTTLTVLGV
jgi:hypothetical protein